MTTGYEQLRDSIALEAMKILMTKKPKAHPDWIASQAYIQADSMLRYKVR